MKYSVKLWNSVEFRKPQNDQTSQQSRIKKAKQNRYSQISQLCSEINIQPHEIITNFKDASEDIHDCTIDSKGYMTYRESAKNIIDVNSTNPLLNSDVNKAIKLNNSFGISNKQLQNETISLSNKKLGNHSKNSSWAKIRPNDTFWDNQTNYESLGN